jgi:histidine triad (HIT) family protein
LNAAPSQQSDDCVFCGIIAQKVPATVVYEDDHVLAFLDFAPATDGHTLVVPKNHAQDLLSVNSEDLAAVATASQAVARLLDDRLKPDGLTVFQANRQAGWLVVLHRPPVEERPAAAALEGRTRLQGTPRHYRGPARAPIYCIATELVLLAAWPLQCSGSGTSVRLRIRG